MHRRIASKILVGRRIALSATLKVYLVFIPRLWWPGGYKGGFCQNLPEASSLPDRACASLFQGGPASANPTSVVVVPQGEHITEGGKVIILHWQ